MRSHILKNIVVLVTVSVSKNRGDSSKLVVIQKASDSRSRICITNIRYSLKPVNIKPYVYKCMLVCSGYCLWLQRSVCHMFMLKHEKID